MKEKGIVLSAPNLSQKLKTALIIVLSWGSGSRLLKDTEIDRERERGGEVERVSDSDTAPQTILANLSRSFCRERFCTSTTFRRK